MLFFHVRIVFSYLEIDKKNNIILKEKVVFHSLLPNVSF